MDHCHTIQNHLLRERWKIQEKCDSTSKGQLRIRYILGKLSTCSECWTSLMELDWDHTGSFSILRNSGEAWDKQECGCRLLPWDHCEGNQLSPQIELVGDSAGQHCSRKFWRWKVSPWQQKFQNSQFLQFDWISAPKVLPCTW